MRDEDAPNSAETNAGSFGILAYGSLLGDPGEELEGILEGRIEDVETPFPVEFARACSCRDQAPTLAPVRWGGARVSGAILTMPPDVSEEAVREALWRRETRPQRRHDSVEPEPMDRVVRRARPLGDRYGLRAVFYTHLEPNIDDRSPARLAELAVRSARSEAGRRGEDGIAYLMEIKRHGISTPLLVPYEREILARTGAETLAAARARLVGPDDTELERQAEHA